MQRCDIGIGHHRHPALAELAAALFDQSGEQPGTDPLKYQQPGANLLPENRQADPFGGARARLWRHRNRGHYGIAAILGLKEATVKTEAMADLEAVVRQRGRIGSKFSIVVVSEGAFPLGGGATLKREADAVRVRRLGGIGLSDATQADLTVR